jgi:hypothetical protein
MDTITLEQAKLFGVNRYFDGIPCVKGHLCERRVYDKACVQCQKEAGASWRERNREDEAQRVKVYYSKNSIRHKQTVDRYRKKNKPKYRAIKAKRRATLLKATPVWVSLKEIERIYEGCPENYHVDHIVPLLGKSVCGLHVPWNLQYLSATDNLRKGNRY